MIARAALAALLLPVATAAHESVTKDDEVKVQGALGQIGCEAKPEDIMEHEGGFEVMEAACADGNYFVVIDGAFEVKKKIKQ